MQKINDLLEKIIQHVNINLRELRFDSGAYIRNLVPVSQLTKFYAFYGVTDHHPLNLHFHGSSLAGSYFLGKCHVSDSILYKSDIRGDELKRKGDIFDCDGFKIPLYNDEAVDIKDSCLVKTLVHNYSHDPESPEIFTIHNTMTMPYANIHGSDMEGCFLGPFSTVDLTTLHDCMIGEFVYLQKNELSHCQVPPGTVWISAGDMFEFHFRHDPEILKNYIRLEPGGTPGGFFMDFVESRKTDFQRIFDVVNLESFGPIPASASLSRYAVVKPKTRISENVLISQRAYIENTWMGKGANAQENCFIINSRLSGYNVTAHGAKIINAHLDENVFVGFNSFLRGSDTFQLKIGENSIIMPHTIIDLAEPVTIAPSNVVWGFIQSQHDVAENSIPLAELETIDGEFSRGRMQFKGGGRLFADAFKHRIDHILEANGAYFDGADKKGHAQQTQNVSYNIMQPYPEGTNTGMYPTIDILP